MIHFIFGVYILTFSLSAAVSLLAFLLAKKYKNILYIYAGLIFLGALLNLLTEIVCLYRFTATNSPYSTTELHHYIFIAISGFLMLYFIPLLVFKVTELSYTKHIQAIHILFLIIILSTLIFEYLHSIEIVRITRDILYALIFLVSSIILLKNSKNIKHKELKAVLISFSILFLVLVPIITVDKFVSLYFFPDNLFFKLPYFNVLFLFTATILATLYGAKFLFTENKSNALESLSKYTGSLNISSREWEIIELLIKGLSNSQIADTLFISQKTVKNHIYHIYQKLGIKNRLELINKILNS